MWLDKLSFSVTENTLKKELKLLAHKKTRQIFRGQAEAETDTSRLKQDRGKTEAEHCRGKFEDEVIKSQPRSKAAASRTTSLSGSIDISQF